jgi:YggT family protein
VIELVCTLAQLYLLAVFARIILSWFPPSPGGGGLNSVREFLFAITEPVLGPLRRIIPPLGMGGMALDLSPIILIIGVQILLAALGCGRGLL